MKKPLPLRWIATGVLLLLMLGLAAFGFLRSADRACDLYVRRMAAVMWIAAGAVGLAALHRRRMKPETLFLLCGAVIGVCFLFCVSPLGVPDEAEHYNTSLWQATALLGHAGETDAAYLSTDDMYPGVTTFVTFNAQFEKLFTEPLTGVTETFSHGWAAYPLEYAPQTLGTVLGLLLGANRWQLYLWGMVFNLAFYLGITWLAIRRVPTGKPLLAVVALMPMALHQAASFSYDSFINAMAFLFLAEVLRCALGHGRLTGRQLAPVLVTGLLLAPAKAVYALMLALFLLIPRERFGGLRRKLLWAAGLCAAALLLILFTYRDWLGAQLTATAATAAETNYGRYTLDLLLAQPLTAARLILVSLNQFLLGDYLLTMVGSLLGASNITVSTAYVMLYLLLLVFAALVPSKEDVRLAPTVRVTGAAVSLGVILAVLCTMLIGWTPVDLGYIAGVQGRYFIPIAALLALSLRPSFVEGSRDLTKPLCLTALLADTLVVWSLLSSIVATQPAV